LIPGEHRGLGRAVNCRRGGSTHKANQKPRQAGTRTHDHHIAVLIDLRGPPPEGAYSAAIAALRLASI